MLRYKLRTLLILLAIGPPVLLSSSCWPALAQENGDPGAALYGEWEVIEMIYHAKVQDFGGQQAGWVFFEPGGFIWRYNQKTRDTIMQNKQLKKSLTYACNIRPREIDITFEDKLLKALYDVKDGKLRIMWREDFERPTDFDDAAKDSQTTLYVLKKAK